MDFVWRHLKLIIATLALLTGTVLLIRYYEKIKKFLIEVKVELSKVSWSTREELIGSTAVVIVITVLIALFIFCIDFLVSFGLRALLR